MRKCIILFFFLLPTIYGFAQKEGGEKMDSLRTALKNTNTDTIRMKYWLALSREFQTIFPDSGIFYGNLALTKATLLRHSSSQVESMLTLGSNYLKKGVQAEALRYFSKALEMSIASNDSLNMAQGYAGLGKLYRYLGDSAKASHNINLSLAISQKLGNQYQMAVNYLTMGSIVNATKQPHEAIRYYEKAITAALLSNNKRVLAYANSNLGAVFTSMKAFRKALGYHLQALKLETAMGDKYGVATEYGSISDVYNGLAASEQGARKTVLQDSAIIFGNQGIELSYECDIPGDRVNMLYSLANVYNARQDYQKTLQLITHAHALKDSVFSNESSKQVQEIETEKEIQLREKEIKIQKLQLDSNRQQKIALVAGILLLIGSTTLLFRNFKKQAAINNKLKETQTQLIQQEKLASLGELTAGIAHEIQNPLNFVNNFSEINAELIEELKEELATGNIENARSLAEDIRGNEEKINFHGKRADGIVKGMLQHSRKSNGQKEATDINALAEEYLRLSYHGLRAKDKSFNATLKTDFDETIASINIIPQDIGRVILNLITNAFYAVNEKKKAKQNGYEPIVSISTKNAKDKISIGITDNGDGIPQKVMDKIYQPFFTTKPAGEGTGLGLSMSYDIVTKGHGGQLEVESNEGKGTTFKITLPK